MKKRTTNGQTISRGSMKQIAGQKEKADAFWGGEANRRKAVNLSCADCLLANCKKNCRGIV